MPMLENRGRITWPNIRIPDGILWQGHIKVSPGNIHTVYTFSYMAMAIKMPIMQPLTWTPSYRPSRSFSIDINSRMTGFCTAFHLIGRDINLVVKNLEPVALFVLLHRAILLYRRRLGGGQASTRDWCLGRCISHAAYLHGHEVGH